MMLPSTTTSVGPKGIYQNKMDMRWWYNGSVTTRTVGYKGMWQVIYN